MTPLVRLVAVLALALSGLALPGASAPAAAAEPTAGQSTYVPRTPVRLLDTRETRQPLGPQEARPLQVAGVQGVPTTATAVVLSVTLLGPTEATSVEVTPGAATAGTTSLVVRARSSASNLVTVPVGPDGSVVLRNARGTVHVVADLSGHYVEGPGSTFVPTTPSRLLDTRPTRTALGARQVRVLRVAGSGTRVPAGATAVALNVTTDGATVSTDLRVYPTAPGAPPFASNTNPGPGRPTSVLAVSGIGRDGSVSIYNAAGSVHLVVDLQGWFVPSSSDDRASVFHPVAPRRLLDTTVDGPALGPAGTRDVLLAGPGDVPAQATGVALTVTAVGATGNTDVRVYPVPRDRTSVPPSSNINPGLGKDVSGSALVAVGRDGSVRLRNNAATVHLQVDLTGWYGPTGRGWDVSWPQCTTRGATTATTPTGGAFAVVGLNRGSPFTDNECFAAEWAWASSLPGEPAVYLNIDAAGASAPQWSAPGPRACDGTTGDAGCAYNYGFALATYSAERMPTTPSGGRPFVWFDVEGGEAWQTGAELGSSATAVRVNQASLDGAAAGLRAAGYASRYGIYTDAEPVPRNDWVQIMGPRKLPDLPLWVFASSNTGTRELCVPPSQSITGGPVQSVQLRPAQSGEAFDVDDLC